MAKERLCINNASNGKPLYPSYYLTGTRIATTCLKSMLKTERLSPVNLLQLIIVLYRIYSCFNIDSIQCLTHLRSLRYDIRRNWQL